MNEFKMLNQAELGALASPLRRELLTALQEPDSATRLARRFDMSRQRIGYHMRELEKAGYIKIVEERRQRGLIERLYRVRPLAYVFAPDGFVASAEAQDRFSWATLINLIAQSLWDLVNLRRRADEGGKRLATLALEAEINFASPSARRGFSEELIQAVERLVVKYDEPGANGSRRHRLLLGAYPSPDNRKSSS
ncbi:MAG: helix-turn-helix domain-containing protein [Gammaproteobacteria bacterium]|nr:helix-turn-helix domain-containing protein [Gammaproteobacteria bacterium]